MTNRSNISFDRFIKIEWLDNTARLSSEDLDPKVIREELTRFLSDKLAGPERKDSACGKAVRLLLRIWVNVNSDMISLRDRGVKLLPSTNADERRALYFMLSLGSFPFFGDVAMHLGRLMDLHGTASTSQVTRRLFEQWGERSTLNFTVLRVLRSLVQWSVLADTDKKGIYQQIPKRLIIRSEISLLLLEALMHYEEKALSLEQVLNHPIFFAFELNLHINDIRQCSTLTVHRQGLNIDVIKLVNGLE